MKDLHAIGLKWGTDKVNGHNYAQPYMTHFAQFENKAINLLEIGVGGEADPNVGGHSLRMWKEYFPKGSIFGIDIQEKSKFNEERIRIFRGDQTDAQFLNQVCREIGDIDVIIDDGSHINRHVITTFEILFPKLKDGGVYVIEDTQTSYWKIYGGCPDVNAKGTMMNYFKALTDCMNNSEFPITGYQKTYYDKKIISMHFYHNMIFIYKGDNAETSNTIVNNESIF